MNVNEYLLSTYFVSGTLLDTENLNMNKITLRISMSTKHLNDVISV